MGEVDHASQSVVFPEVPPALLRQTELRQREGREEDADKVEHNSESKPRQNRTDGNSQV